MSVNIETRSAGERAKGSAGASVRAARGMSLPSRALIAAAAALIALSLLLPLWGMRMDAPQYPEGLGMQVYAGRIAGEVEIINVLNHYVGMKAIRAEDFPELRFMPAAVAALALATLAAALAGRRWGVLAILVLMVAGAAAGLWDLRRWLYAYGHDLDPDAPLDFEPFTPPMVGENAVWNFKTTSFFLPGTYLLVLAAGLILLALWKDGKWAADRALVGPVSSEQTAARWPQAEGAASGGPLGAPRPVSGGGSELAPQQRRRQEGALGSR